MNKITAVEEADIALCADGFDNFVMNERGEELREYLPILIEIGANRCASVIDELIRWIDSSPEKEPLDILASDKEREKDLWDRYNEASCDENPQDLVEQLLDKNREPAPKLKDAYKVVQIDLEERIDAGSTTDVWHSFQGELKELNPSTRGSALKTKNSTIQYLSDEFGGPVEIRFINSSALSASGEVGRNAVEELRRFFSMSFKVPEKYIKVTWSEWTQLQNQSGDDNSE